MGKLNVKDIRKIRESTGAGVLEVKNALEKYDGDVKKVEEHLREKGKEKAKKKASRTASDGLVYSYIHSGGKVGAMVVIACETDFVAKTDDFVKLCKEVAMQVCTDDYKNVRELLKAEYMRDSSRKVSDLVTDAVAKLGENIEIKNFVKFAVGE